MFNQYNATPVLRQDGESVTQVETDVSGNAKATLATALSGAIDGVTAWNPAYLQTRCTADTLVLTGTGRIHKIRITQPAAATPTAGVLTVYDNAAESGTVLFQHYIPNAAITSAIEWDIDSAVGTGIYVGFDATLAGVVVTVSFVPTASL